MSRKGLLTSLEDVSLWIYTLIKNRGAEIRRAAIQKNAAFSSELGVIKAGMKG